VVYFKQLIKEDGPIMDGILFNCFIMDTCIQMHRMEANTHLLAFFNSSVIPLPHDHYLYN